MRGWVDNFGLADTHAKLSADRLVDLWMIADCNLQSPHDSTSGEHCQHHTAIFCHYKNNGV